MVLLMKDYRTCSEMVPDKPKMGTGVDTSLCHKERLGKETGLIHFLRDWGKPLGGDGEFQFLLLMSLIRS